MPNLIGGVPSAKAVPYSPSELGACGDPLPTERFASASSARTTPTAAPASSPMPPPPNAAPVAIRRATLALDRVPATATS